MQNQFIKDYLEFHRKFNFALPESFTIPDEETLFVRLNFLFEELKETATALGYDMILHSEDGKVKGVFVKDKIINKNPAAAIDGLVDLMYVLLGTAAFMGLMNDHKSEMINNTAVFDVGCKTIFEKAWDVVHKANMQKVRATRKEQSTRGTIVDCIKPPGWKPPDLSQFTK